MVAHQGHCVQYHITASNQGKAMRRVRAARGRGFTLLHARRTRPAGRFGDRHASTRVATRSARLWRRCRDCVGCLKRPAWSGSSSREQRTATASRSGASNRYVGRLGGPIGHVLRPAHSRPHDVRSALPSQGECPMAVMKRRWVTPDVRNFGTFEAVTNGCDKTLGSSDGFTFQGQAVICTGS